MTAAKLSPEDIDAIRDALLPTLSAQIDRVDRSVQLGFNKLEGRLASLDERVRRLEGRVAALVGGHTRSRTEDLERIAALEARVEALEKALAAKG